MSNYSDAAAGLVTVLKNGITGLQAQDHPVDSINSFPAAIVLPEPLDYLVAVGGNSFTGTFRVVFLISSGDDAEGFTQLYDHIDPTALNESVRKAVEDGRTLDGKVDDAQVVRVENIGRRELWGGYYFGADFIVEFIKTVA